MRYSLALFITVALFAQLAFAFEEEGYSSGMQLKDVAEKVQATGMELIPTTESPNFAGYIAARRDRTGKIEIPPSSYQFSFCKGRLIDFGRSVDFDADYAQLLEDVLGKQGQPSTTRVDHVLSERGSYVSISQRWYVGKDRIELSFSPQSRSGSGELRWDRSARVSFSTQIDCWRKNW